MPKKERVRRRKSTRRQVSRLRHFFLSFYAGTSFLTLFVLHGTAGQYFKELGVPFSFEWTIEDGITTGAAFGIAICLLSWISIKIFERKTKRYSSLICAVLNGSLMVIFFIAAYPFTPGWTDYEFVGEIVLFGLVLSISTYLYLGLGNPEPYQSIDAMKLQHARSLQNLRDLIWVLMFVMATIVFSYILTFESKVPKDLRHTSAFQVMMAIHAVGIIYLLVGIILNIVAAYHQHVKKIEERIDKLNKK